MASLILILALCLLGLILVALAFIVMGIHRDDHAKTLTYRPHSSLQAATRRLLGVGVRNSQSNVGEE